MKNFLKIAVTLALLAIIVLGYQFGELLDDKSEMQDVFEQYTTRVDSLRQQLYVYQRHAEADELFIAGDYDEAID